jgi:hypothetical protein
MYISYIYTYILYTYIYTCRLVIYIYTYIYTYIYVLYRGSPTAAKMAGTIPLPPKKNAIKKRNKYRTAAPPLPRAAKMAGTPPLAPQKISMFTLELVKQVLLY